MNNDVKRIFDIAKKQYPKFHVKQILDSDLCYYIVLSDNDVDMPNTFCVKLYKDSDKMFLIAPMSEGKQVFYSKVIYKEGANK